MALRFPEFLRSLAASACAATLFGSAALAEEPTPMAPPAPSVADDYAAQPPAAGPHDHSVAGSHGWTHHQPHHTPHYSYCYEDCWPRVPNMIGDVTYGALGDGGGGGLMRMTNFIGFSNPQAAEIIPLTGTIPNATFQSAFINEAFMSLNPNVGFTNQTVIALQQNTELLNLARARFGSVTFIGGQAVPLGLANQVPALVNGVVTPLTVNGITVPTLQGPTGGQGTNATTFPGSVFNQDLIVNPGGAPIAVGDQYIILNTLDVIGGGSGLFLPAPGGPTQYARVSHNNSPLPQDRVFFNYDYLDTTINSTDVNYYVFGVEKTFMDGRFSIQVDIPFFDGPDSDVDSIGATDVEFGNIPIWLKALLYQSQNTIVSAGLGINTPTASDVDLFLGGPQPLLRVENNSTHLMPFVSGIYRPSRNLFFQGFAQLDFDANGNDVFVNQGAGLTKVGTLDAQTLLHLDAGMGYMLYENRQGGMLQAITPMVELHYTTDLDNDDIVQTGATPIGTLSQYDVLNITGGANLQLNDRANLNVGVGAPLTDDGPGDRVYDWRASVQLNIMFGGR